MSAAHIRSEWQFVIHVGKHFQLPVMKISSNSLIFEEIPQLALLRRAVAMAHHGGTSSIRECIHFEVPMVITPGLRDQPGNAIRAAHHGIALTYRMSRITSKRLVSLLEQAIQSSEIRKNLSAMKAKIVANSGMNDAIQWIERR